MGGSWRPAPMNLERYPQALGRSAQCYDSPMAREAVAVNALRGGSRAELRERPTQLPNRMDSCRCCSPRGWMRSRANARSRAREHAPPPERDGCGQLPNQPGPSSPLRAHLLAHRAAHYTRAIRRGPSDTRESSRRLAEPGGPCRSRVCGGRRRASVGGSWASLLDEIFEKVEQRWHVTLAMLKSAGVFPPGDEDAATASRSPGNTRPLTLVDTSAH